MCGGFVDWCSFTWEAFATLATGLAAVFAAYLVGRKQSQIQADQLEIERLALKSSLFDRRFEIYTITEAFVEGVVSGNGHLPPSANGAFWSGRRKSRFVFRKTVFDGLDEIYVKAVELERVTIENTSAMQSKKPKAELLELKAKKEELNAWFRVKREDFHDLFEEMHLGK
jgi:hypothetical protein